MKKYSSGTNDYTWGTCSHVSCFDCRSECCAQSLTWFNLIRFIFTSTLTLPHNHVLVQLVPCLYPFPTHLVTPSSAFFLLLLLFISHFIHPSHQLQSYLNLISLTIHIVLRPLSTSRIPKSFTHGSFGIRLRQVYATRRHVRLLLLSLLLFLFNNSQASQDWLLFRTQRCWMSWGTTFRWCFGI